MSGPEMTATRRAMLQASVAAAVTAAVGPARAATPFFKLYFMIPNNQPARVAWGTLAAQQMQRLEIKVVSSIVPFTASRPGAPRATARRTWTEAGTPTWSAATTTPSSLRRSRCSAP